VSGGPLRPLVARVGITIRPVPSVSMPMAEDGVGAEVQGALRGASERTGQSRRGVISPGLAMDPHVVNMPQMGDPDTTWYGRAPKEGT
jgi:hypothetical protein